MSAGDRRIICRRCQEAIGRSLGSCPHCGAEIRSVRVPVGLVLVGLVLLIPSLVNLERLWWIGVVGLILAFGGAYFLYDRRARIQRAESV